MQKRYLNIKILVRFFSFLLICTGMNLALSLSIYADDSTSSDLQAKLDAITNKIKSYNSLVNQTQQQRTTLSTEIKSLEVRAHILEQKITDNQSKLETLDDQMSGLQQKIAGKEQSIVAQKEMLKKLVRVYYENENTQNIQFLLSSQEALSRTNQSEWTSETGDKIQETLTNIQVAKNQIVDEQKNLTYKKDETSSLQAQLEQRSDYLESTKQTKALLVEKTQRQEKKYNNIIDDLEEKQKEIENELNQLDADKIDELDLSKLPAFNKSTLYFPVADPHKSQGYGKATWTKWYSFHNGVDFADKTGTPIIATADGTVLATGNAGKYAYGKWIALDHANGLVTLYGHLNSQKVSKGDRVKRGEIIGLMGNTGYSTGSHVHFTVFAKNSFEVVESSKIKDLMLPTGATVNPMKYLP
jgi:murein DD-endopeptidase MepM/ murein hydrolase activator NlpD